MKSFENLSAALSHMRKEPETLAYPALSLIIQVPILVSLTWLWYLAWRYASQFFGAEPQYWANLAAIAGFFTALAVSKYVGTVFEYAVVHSVNESHAGNESTFSGNLSKAMETKGAIGYAVVGSVADGAEWAVSDMVSSPLRAIPVIWDLLAAIFDGAVDFAYSGAVFLSLPMACIEQIPATEAFKKAFSAMKKYGKFWEFSVSTLFIDIFAAILLLALVAVEIAIFASGKIFSYDFAASAVSLFSNAGFMASFLVSALFVWILADSMKCIAKTRSYLELRDGNVFGNA